MKLIGKSAALAAALFLAFQPQVDAGEADRHVLAYRIRLAGFVVGKVDVTAELGRGEYRLAAETRNVGLLRLLAGFTSRARSRGRFASGEVMPLAHQADNVWVGEKRYVRNSYGEDGGVSAKVFPPAASDERDPIPKHELVGTVDPLSAALWASLRASGADACRGTIAVFDGRRRYDLLFERVGGGEISGPIYQGPGIHCRVTLNRIAGFSRRPWLARASSPDSVELWLAKVVAELPPLPVLLTTDIGLGRVEVDLVSLTTATAAADRGAAVQSPGSGRESPTDR